MRVRDLQGGIAEGAGEVVGARNRGVAPIALAVVGMLTIPACGSSAPFRSIRAARYYAHGSRALDRGDSVEAIAALERAASLMPSASEVRNHLGLAYWSGGRSDDALRELERAVELDCDNEAARANLQRLRAERATTPTTTRQVHGG